MPLTMGTIGERYIVKRINGRSEIHRFLEGLGLVPGTEVGVVSRNDSGLIVNVKESRIALGIDVANRILV
ncbi:MAG: FeoA family protein [Coriobacteriia bacterium]|nr:FeoA family protein [Coriobacteriia bacterium]